MKGTKTRILILTIASIVLVSLIFIGCSGPPSASTAPSTTVAPPATTTNAPATTTAIPKPSTTASSPAASTSSSTTPAGKVITWKAEEPFGPGDFTTQYIINPTWDMIEKASNGLVKIQRYPAEGLVASADMVTAVSSGALDAAGIPSVFYTGEIGKIGYSELGLPYAWLTPEDAVKVYYDGGIEDLLKEAYAKKGIYHLGNGLSGRFCLFTSFPVKSISDISGKKIRASGAFAPVLANLGAGVVTMPPPDIYMGMKLGTIDGYNYSVPELEGMGLKEVAKYVIFPPMLSNVGTGIVINQKSWDALPADVKTNIQKAFMDSVLPNAQKLMAEDDKAIKSSGINVVTLSNADVQKVRDASLAYWNVYAKEDPLCAKAVQILKNYYKLP